MRISACLTLCLAVGLAGPALAAQQKRGAPPQPPAATVAPPAVQGSTEGTLNAPPMLFQIGDLPVRLGAPIQPNYDQRNNRNGAANPVWDGNPL